MRFPRTREAMRVSTVSGRARRGWLVVLVALVSLAAAGCIPPGTHTVSSFGAGGVSPGLWRSLGGGEEPGPFPFSGGCTWGTPGHYRGGGSGGPVYAEIRSTDSEIWVSGRCAPFWQVPGPFARPLATPGKPFGHGDYLVGYEVAPGTYASSSSGAPYPEDAPHCQWSRVRDFQDTSPGSASIIASGGDGPAPLVVVIKPGDYGFTSTGCSTWTKIG
jgi:hypothetical protein